MFSCFNICVFYLKSTDLFNVGLNTLSPVKYLYSFLMFFISHVLSSAGLRTDLPGSLQRPLGLSACGGRRRCWAVSMMSVRMKCEPLWHHRDLSDVISVSSQSVSHIQKNDALKPAERFTGCYHDDEVGLHAVTWSSSSSWFHPRELLIHL